MSDDAKGILLVVGGVAALFFLIPLAIRIIGFVLGLVNLAMGLLWLVAIVAVLIFVVGLVRRIIRG
jgi:hypothetical protein